MALKFEHSNHPIPSITREQMIEVDRIMTEDWGISLMQMMEQAGYRLAVLAGKRFLDADVAGKRVAILAGKGGNGGGAMVCGRLLSGWGCQVTTVLAGEPGPGSAADQQLDILGRLEVPLISAHEVEALPQQNLIIDGMVGYGLAGTLRGDLAGLAKWVNNQSVPVLSLDVPSGIDANLGRQNALCVMATATLTLALPKVGLLAAGAKSHVGELYLADIGVPRSVFSRLQPPIPEPDISWKEGLLRLQANP